MNKEFSAGAIIFTREEEKILFLLIYSGRNNIWGFPKGHIEPGETEQEAALRETAEETGLCGISFIKGFREENIYETMSKRLPYKGQFIEKHSIYFLCEVKTKNIKVDSHEIIDYKWLELKEALTLFSFESMRDILKKADRYILKL